ncbi:unnamed protein product [Hyaloperonospora brassicae]|uniref:RxLR effector candidate protein n=1 Tax=Hyaloperonospora brassicae TaxID=162125 RepID=A0AAV0US52_HYABA|nr:unnamed protein product [Hyaloperonospora brassicae]
MKTGFALLAACVAHSISFVVAGGPKSGVPNPSGGLEEADAYLKAHDSNSGDKKSYAFDKITPSTDDAGGETLGDSVVAATETDLTVAADPLEVVTLSPELKKRSGIDKGAIDTVSIGTVSIGTAGSFSSSGASTDFPTHDYSKATKGGDTKWTPEPAGDSEESASSSGSAYDVPQPTPAATVRSPEPVDDSEESASSSGSAYDVPPPPPPPPAAALESPDPADDSEEFASSSGSAYDVPPPPPPPPVAESESPDPADDSEESSSSSGSVYDVPQPTPAPTLSTPTQPPNQQSNNQHLTQPTQWDKQPNNQQLTQPTQWDKKPINQQQTQPTQWDKQPSNQQPTLASKNEHDQSLQSQGPQPAPPSQSSHWQGAWNANPPSSSQKQWEGEWGSVTQSEPEPTPAPTRTNDPSQTSSKKSPATGETIVFGSAPSLTPSPLTPKCVVRRLRR